MRQLYRRRSMKTRLKTVYILLILSLASVAMIGCDGNGETVVIVEEGGYLYEPAVIRNDSWDDILLDSAIFGEIYLPPGSAVELDVGPDVDQIFVYINGMFFNEIYVASGDVVIYD
jgi:hypothetical protein